MINRWKQEIYEKLLRKEITPQEALNLYKQEDNNISVQYFSSNWEQSCKYPDSHHNQLLGNILVFDEADEIADEKTVVKYGSEYCCVNEKSYVINPDYANDYAKLVHELVQADMIPDTVIFKWSGKNNNTEYGTDFIRLFCFCKSLIGQKITNRIKILCFSIYSEDMRQAEFDAVAGFARTLKNEYPSITIKLIRISKEELSIMGMNQIAAFETVEDATEEKEIDYHNGKRYIKTTRRIHGLERKTPFRQSGTYLIIGGTGGLGILISRYLLKNFHANLVLTGRSESKQEILDDLMKYADYEDQIEYIQSDVTKAQDVDSLIANVKQKHELINGVIHSAGLYVNGFIVKKEYEDIKKVIMPKVNGALYLDQALKDEKLDFFLLYSSLASVTGKVGQSDYSYANCFFDYFAEYRQKMVDGGKRYGRTVAINWPYWAEGGMQIEDYEKDTFYEKAGIEPLPTERGIEAIEKIIFSNRVQCAVVYGSEEKICSYVQNNMECNINQSLEEEPDEIIEGLSEKVISEEELYSKTEDFLKEIIIKEIGIPKSKLNSKIRFEEYGIDSIIINQFNAEIEKKIGTMSKTLLFEYQTIEEMTNFMVENYHEKLVELFGDSIKKIKKITQKKQNTEPKQGSNSSYTEEIAESKIKKRKEVSNDDIAIIGMSGKYPKADNVDVYWDNLLTETDCISAVPEDRWDMNTYYDANINHAQEGKIYCNWGGFLNDIYDFDPLFFNISPTEAAAMDPQERLLLEQVYKAIQDAGYTRQTLKENARLEKGKDVGVFVAATTFSYPLCGSDEWEKGNHIIPTSNGWDLANRISYIFDFNGISIPVDTACSSGLTAMHLACESIKNGECGAAIVGGVNLYLHPSKYIRMCQLKMLAKDGKCKSFGEGADGFIPGEGVGAFIIKPLEKAVMDHDHIYGVIRGTAVNHGGRTHGFTVPNPKLQTAVIMEAMEKAGINAEEVSYIEAHGTGTELGDPIEINALQKAFEKDTDRKRFCSIGSVKSNIGHTESCAGIAGITKILLQMKHGKLVKTLNCDKENNRIDFQNTAFVLQKEVVDWIRPVLNCNGISVVGKRIAGISSFGAGGVNAHILIEEYENARIMAEKKSKKDQLVVISAKNEEALRISTEQLYTFLKANRKFSLPLPSCIGDIEAVINQHIMDRSLISDKDIEKYTSAFDSLDQYIKLLLGDAFLRMGINNENAHFENAAALKNALNIFSLYDGLTDAFLEILGKSEYLEYNGEILFTKQITNMEVEKRKTLLSGISEKISHEYPEIIPYLKLINTCVAAYPEVLTNKLNHADVMFPDGRMDLVEKIYQGNKVVDYFNKTTACLICEWIKHFAEARPGEEVQILEIGAGTGGTSKFILKGLKELEIPIRYCYTDISRGFTQYGKKTFGAYYDFVDYEVLDVEKDIEEQGFQPDFFHLVVASNVIHATKNITNSLSHINNLLKKNGVLILNESIQRLDYSTLTFGLTNGWWLFEDKDCRIKYSPILYTESWKKELNKTGFIKTKPFGLPGRPIEESIQNVIISEKERDIQEQEHVNVNFDDMVYTLQMGREHQDYRLACIASSADELMIKLGIYLEQGEEVSVYTGSLDEKSQVIDILLAGKSGRKIMDMICAENDLTQIAKLWIAGVDIDFSSNWKSGDAYKMSLPTYVFENDHYDIRTKENSSYIYSLHPMIDRNISSLDGLIFMKKICNMDRYVYTVQLGNKEIWTVMSLLDMAYAAGSLVNHSALKAITDVRWGRPVMLQEQEEVINTYIFSDERGISFEVAGTLNDGRKVVHLQGEYDYGQEDNGEKILSICKSGMKSDHREIYDKLNNCSLKYQETMQCIKSGYMVQGKWNTAAFELEEEKTDNVSVMSMVNEGIMQAVNYMLSMEENALCIYMPYTVGSVEFKNDVYRAKWLLLQKSRDDIYSYDVSVTDEHGYLIMEFFGMEFKQLQIRQS